MKEIQELTMITEVPIIRTDSGDLLNLGGDFLSLAPEVQREIARNMGGKIVWIKVRAICTPVNNMCTHKGCYNYKCETHVRVHAPNHSFKTN